MTHASSEGWRRLADCRMSSSPLWSKLTTHNCLMDYYGFLFRHALLNIFCDRESFCEFTVSVLLGPDVFRTQYEELGKKLAINLELV